MRISKTTFILLLISLVTDVAMGQFQVSGNKRYLVKDGKPFFWLGDTAWELFHRLNREETNDYLRRRSEQGFTVVQAVVLAELDGLHTPNAYNAVPLINDDPEKPNEKYFEHVDYVIDKAAEYGISIGLLPTWGDKLFRDKWGKGPEIFDSINAEGFATWLARRYGMRKNIIWIIGGDRTPRGAADLAVWRAMGNAIKAATNNRAVISFHPQPNTFGSAEYFHSEPWLDFNMFQTGHCRDTKVYDKIRSVYNMNPVKPVMDAEPIYEDHPVCFNAHDLGTSNAFDVRKAAYLNLFAGAFGHTYGCHDVWQMYSEKTEPVNGPHVFWREALELPGAKQMKHVRTLLERYDFANRAPAQEILATEDRDLAAAERVQATIGTGFFMIYSAAGRSFSVNLGKLKGAELSIYWFDPRNGKSTTTEVISNRGNRKFVPPSNGYGQDWILVAEQK